MAFLQRVVLWIRSLVLLLPPPRFLALGMRGERASHDIAIADVLQIAHVSMRMLGAECWAAERREEAGLAPDTCTYQMPPRCGPAPANTDEEGSQKGGCQRGPSIIPS